MTQKENAGKNFRRFSLANLKYSILLLERLDACRKARDFARNSFLVDEVLAARAVQMGLSCLEGRLCRFLVARLDRLFYLAHIGAGLGETAFVAGGHARIATHTFFG